MTDTTDTAPRRSLRTHAEALLGNHLGQPIPSCSGALRLLSSGQGDILRNGELVYRTIYVYECVECGSRISIAREIIEGEGDPTDPRDPPALAELLFDWELLNAYRPQTLPPADRLATELAHAFELPSSNGQQPHLAKMDRPASDRADGERQE